MPRTKMPKCTCGATIGLWFNPQLGRYICPPCVVLEVHCELIDFKNEVYSHSLVALRALEKFEERLKAKLG